MKFEFESDFEAGFAYGSTFIVTLIAIFAFIF